MNLSREQQFPVQLNKANLSRMLLGTERTDTLESVYLCDPTFPAPTKCFKGKRRKDGTQIVKRYWHRDRVLAWLQRHEEPEDMTESIRYESAIDYGAMVKETLTKIGIKS